MTPRRLVVLGMHRSGTSVLTQLLHQMGCFVGAPGDLPRPDRFNPTGYWEHRAVVALDENILDTVASSWFEEPDLSRLSTEQWTRFVGCARQIATTLDAHGTWVVKDPRMVVTFPLWREALQGPVCVLIWREPIAVARSLASRQGFTLRFGLLLWELYVRKMLAHTITMPRVLVSYRQLVDGPLATARHLQETLATFGAELAFPTAVEGAVQRKLDRRSAGAAADELEIDSRQHALAAALRDASALSWTQVPNLPPATQAELQALAGEYKAITAARFPRGGYVLRAS